MLCCKNTANMTVARQFAQTLTASKTRNI